MKRLFEKIYRGVIVYERDMEAVGSEIEQKNEKVSLRYEGKLKESEIEELMELLDDIALSAEEEGFYMGVRYAFRWMLAIMK